MAFYESGGSESALGSIDTESTSNKEDTTGISSDELDDNQLAAMLADIDSL